MSSFTKLMRIYPKQLSFNAISICKNSHDSTIETKHVGEVSEDAELQKQPSKRIEEFRKKLRETTPINDLGEQPLHVSQTKEDPLPPWPNNTNPHTGEVGGPRGPEPTRYGDWERKGRCSDF